MGHYDKFRGYCLVPEGNSAELFKSSTDDEMGFTKEHTTFATGGQKDTTGKARFDLIPPEAMKSLTEVYALGTGKYDDRNWEKGIPFSAAVAALKRHLNAFELGDMINTADGDRKHIEHVMWWAVALVTFVARGRDDLNDLPHYQEDFNSRGDK
jgi:hypothetical protein